MRYRYLAKVEMIYLYIYSSKFLFRIFLKCFFNKKLQFYFNLI